MFSLVKFDNGEYSVLSTKRVRLIEGKKCSVRYSGGSMYSACILDTSGNNKKLLSTFKQ